MPPPSIGTHKPKTNNRPTTHPDWNPKPKPNKRYSYPQRRRGDPYLPVLILVANQVYPHVFSFSPILPFFFKKKIPRAAPMLVLRSWFLSWRRRRKKKVESLWFFKVGIWDLQTWFPEGNRVFKTKLLAKSSLTNSRY